MTEEEKKEARINWRFRWLGLIFEFAHLEYQKGLWVDHVYPNEIGWFGEDICQYFDDLSLDDNYEYQLKENIISLEEYNIVKEFHFALDDYIEEEKKLQIEMEDIQRINDRKWLSIVELANISWNNLKHVISDKREIERMRGLEKNYIGE